MGEFELIARYFTRATPKAVLGVGAGGVVLGLEVVGKRHASAARSVGGAQGAELVAALGDELVFFDNGGSGDGVLVRHEYTSVRDAEKKRG